jgi:Protein of unknown function (DUF2845)
MRALRRRFDAADTVGSAPSSLARLFASLALCATLAAAVPARAEGGFRCGGRVVRNGETEDDVAGKCGDPDDVRSWTEVHTESAWEYGRKIERSVSVDYDEWKYDFGPDRLIRYVTFVRGRLTAVRTGEYGRK